MTGYLESEIIGKSVNELCDVLRIVPKFDLNQIVDKKEYFLFAQNCANRRTIAPGKF